MRKIILSILFLFLTINANATIVYVSGSGGNGGSSLESSQTTDALSTTTGNFIAVIIGFTSNSNTVSSVTDTAGNTYHQCPNCYALQNNTAEDIWYAYNITGNSNNIVTVNFTGNAQYVYISQAQYSGIQTSNPYQTSAHGAADSTSVTTTSFSPTIANGIVIAMFNINGGPSSTAGTNYTLRYATNGTGWEDYIGAPSGSQTASVSWTGSQEASIGALSLSPAVATQTIINDASLNDAVIN